MPSHRLSSVERARRAGMLAAAREHERLGSSLDGPVDVFGVIRRAGIWLMFQPLEHLYGAYYREGDAAGIIINAKHPQSLQRFTAAHEYGHYVLGHEPVLDQERHIEPLGQVQDPRELEAQTFAAFFLMPLSLVNRLLKRLGFSERLDQLTPRDAYLLSLELGASYAATVNHLLALRKITPAKAEALRREEPKTIKEEVGHGQRPAHPWADTWPLELRDTGKTLYPRVRDEIHLYLPEAPTTGYMWTVENDGIADRRDTDEDLPIEDHVYLVWVDDTFEPESGDLFGSSGLRHLVFRVARAGTHQLTLAHRRPWGIDEQPFEKFAARLEIAPPPVGNVDHGLSDEQQPLIAVA